MRVPERDLDSSPGAALSGGSPPGRLGGVALALGKGWRVWGMFRSSRSTGKPSWRERLTQGNDGLAVASHSSPTPQVHCSPVSPGVRAKVIISDLFHDSEARAQSSAARGPVSKTPVKNRGLTGSWGRSKPTPDCLLGCVLSRPVTEAELQTPGLQPSPRLCGMVLGT